MKDLIMKELLGVEIKALCNDRQVHTIALTELLNPENSTYSTDKKKVNVFGKEAEKYIVDIHLECEGYDTVVDGIRLNLLSSGEDK